MNMQILNIVRIVQIPKILFKAGIICILLSCFPACESLPEKPTAPYNALDPNNPNYQKPQVIFIDLPDSNLVLTTDQVTFLWEGNQPDMNFRTKLDDEQWSSYSSATSVTYEDLDEFGHVFQVQGQYASGDTGEIKTVNFTVDAVKGPALMLLPKKIIINNGSQFVVDLWVDETDSIAGVSTKILYDQVKVQVESVDFLETNNESFLLANGGELITFSSIDNNNGIVDIDCGVVTGNPKNVIGNGKIARLTLTHLSGTSTHITISSMSELRNNKNEAVYINNLSHLDIIVL